MRWIPLLLWMGCAPDGAFEDAESDVAWAVDDWVPGQAGPPIGPANNSLTLTQLTPAMPGVGNTFEIQVTGADPGQRVALIRSTTGLATSTWCPLAMNRHCAEIDQPRLVRRGVANAAGTITFSLRVPPAVSNGTTRWYQAGAGTGGSSIPNWSDPLEASVGAPIGGGGGPAPTCAPIVPDVVLTTVPAMDQQDSCNFDETFIATCGGNQRNQDVVYAFTAPATGAFRFTTTNSGSASYDTAMHLRDPNTMETVTGTAPDVDPAIVACGMQPEEVACDDDSGSGLLSGIDYSMVGGQTILVVVDGYSGSNCGRFQLDIFPVP